MSAKPKMAMAEAVLKENQDRLMSIPGVVGVGIGGSTESPAIVVMVAQATRELKKKIPSQLSGVPVQIDVSGEISAF